MADANTFMMGVVLPRAIGLPANESLRIGAISAAAAGGNLQQTSLLSALLARRRRQELDRAKSSSGTVMHPMGQQQPQSPNKGL